MNRRKFIGTSVAATLAAKTAFAGGMPKMVRPIGVQLYTVRDAMKSDFEGTVAKVAATGYKEVEFAGYFGRSPQDIRALLDKNGLTSPSCHVPYSTLEKTWPEALDAAHTIGHKLIVSSTSAANPPRKPASSSPITTTLSNFRPRNLSMAAFPTTTS